MIRLVVNPVADPDIWKSFVGENIQYYCNLLHYYKFQLSSEKALIIMTYFSLIYFWKEVMKCTWPVEELSAQCGLKPESEKRNMLWMKEGK